MIKFYFFIALFLVSSYTNCQKSCIIDTNLCYIKKQYVGGKILLEKKIESIDSVPTTITPLLADINGDCIPEIIVTNDGNFHNREILFIDSRTGKTIHKIKTFGIYSNPTNMLVADIDRDDIPEIFMIVLEISLQKQLRNKIICYNLDGSIRWISDEPFYNPQNRDYSGNLGIADFNQDGIPEVFVCNSIFNAITGKLLIHGDNNGLGHFQGSLTIAANFDKDISDIELAAGYTVFKVAINNTDGVAGNTMIANNININGEYIDGFTAIADINKDGILDVIVSGYRQFDPLLYAYTFVNSRPILLASIKPESSIETIGSPAIGNIDGTNIPSIIVSGRDKLHSFIYNGSRDLLQKWSINIYDGSQYTSVVLFDLDGDGIQEIIYRDETHLYIINENSNLPIVQSKYLCQSATGRESPIIGDIFGNKTSNICITCSDVEVGHEGKITIFGSPDSLPPWAPARRVWNQYAYNVLNINDDLTVPQYQKNNATYENGRYNNFMQQQSLLDSNGNYKVRAGSLDGIIHCINYDPITNQYTVTFDIYNRSTASLTIPAGLPVSFFNGDPQGSGALIGVYHTLSDIPPGGSLTNLMYTFSSSNLSQLFMVVNSDKTNFNPIDDNDFLNPECDYLDNFSQNTSIPQVEVRVDSMCHGDSYIFGDTTIITEGIYHRKFQNSSGCDSLYVSLELKLIDTLLFISKHAACDSFEWRGDIYTESGFYTQNFVRDNGCDSSIAIDLTIHHSRSSTIQHTACDSFLWHGNILTQSGLYHFDTLNALDCDSTVTLDLTINHSDESTLTKTVCDAYTWHGVTYDETGQYTFDTMTALGCDSMVTLNLFIRDTIKESDVVHICQGDSILIFGEFVSEERFISQHFLTADGCDSVQSFEVVLDPLPQGQVNRSICDGDSVFVIDRWLKEEGVVTIQKSNIDDCDSLIRVQIHVVEDVQIKDTISICEGDSLFMIDRWLKEEGEYDITRSNTDHCDSIFSIKVIVLQSARSDDTISICEGDSILIFGRQVSEEMDLMQTFLGTIGCDSLAFVHVRLLPIASSSISYTLCPGDSIFIDGRWIKEEGIYTDNLKATNGCDSTILTDVKILETPNPPTAELDCETLEIIASVEVQNPWSIQWDNGDTSSQTTYIDQSQATLTLFAQPNCQQQFTIDLPTIPHLGGAGSHNDTILAKGGSLTMDLGLDPNEWSVVWSPSDVVSCDTCMKVVISPNSSTSSGSVDITISYRHISGCIFESMFNIKLVDEGIYIPNAFTPNGDGLNDHWRPFHTPNITLTHIQVYDRWGDLVYDSNNHHLLQWDGRFNNQNAPPAVYTYVVEYLNAKGETMVKAGDVTLVR